MKPRTTEKLHAMLGLLAFVAFIALVIWAVMSCSPTRSIGRQSGVIGQNREALQDQLEQSDELASSSEQRFERIGQLGASSEQRMVEHDDAAGTAEQQEIQDHASAGQVEQAELRSLIADNADRAEAIRLANAQIREDLTQVRDQQTSFERMLRLVAWIVGGLAALAVVFFLFRSGAPLVLRPLAEATGWFLGGAVQKARAQQRRLEAAKRRGDADAVTEMRLEIEGEREDDWQTDAAWRRIKKLDRRERIMTPATEATA